MNTLIVPAATPYTPPAPITPSEEQSIVADVMRMSEEEYQRWRSRVMGVRGECQPLPDPEFFEGLRRTTQGDCPF